MIRLVAIGHVLGDAATGYRLQQLSILRIIPVSPLVRHPFPDQDH